MPEYRPDPQRAIDAEIERQARRLGGPALVAERRREAIRREFEEREAERVKRVKAWEAAERKKREERAVALEADRTARTAAAAAELKGRLKFAFLQTPGSTESAFEKAWPRLLEEHQIRETLNATHGTLAEQIASEMKAARGHPDFFERPAVPTVVAIESDD
jgi:hypothetical protein